MKIPVTVSTVHALEVMPILTPQNFVALVAERRLHKYFMEIVERQLFPKFVPGWKVELSVWRRMPCVPVDAVWTVIVQR